MVVSALATQSSRAAPWACASTRRARSFPSCRSVSCCARTTSLSRSWLSVLTIGSKFLLRVDGKHLFNPTNFGIAATMAATGAVWVSPGQWGTGAFFAFLMACLGGLVIHRAARSDVTYAFIVVLRDGPLRTRPLARRSSRRSRSARSQNGAFLLFSFFMISDPKTTPESRAGRILFALVVALGAGFVQFVALSNERPHLVSRRRFDDDAALEPPLSREAIRLDPTGSHTPTR